MSTKRHRAREIAFQFLFHEELARLNTIESYFHHFEVDLSVREFAKELAQGVLANMDSIDATITSKMNTDWRFSRIATVDKAILRLAVYEMLFREDIPTNVSINEAVELAKRYGNEHSAAFTNGILDTIRLIAPPKPLAPRQESSGLTHNKTESAQSEAS